MINFVEPRPENNTIIEDLLTLYPDIPALGSPFGTGNQTFGLSPIFKEFAAILGDSQFQSQRRYFLGEANKYGLTETWGYLFNEDTPGAPPYYGCESILVITRYGLTMDKPIMGRKSLSSLAPFPAREMLPEANPCCPRP